MKIYAAVNRSEFITGLKLALPKGPNFLPSHRDGNRSSFPNVVLSSFRIPDYGRSPESQVLKTFKSATISGFIFFS
jgi:hypothetical protein